MTTHSGDTDPRARVRDDIFYGDTDFRARSEGADFSHIVHATLLGGRSFESYGVNPNEVPQEPIRESDASGLHANEGDASYSADIPQHDGAGQQSDSTLRYLDVLVEYLGQPFPDLAKTHNGQWARTVLDAMHSDIQRIADLFTERPAQSRGGSPDRHWHRDSESAGARVVEELVGLVDTCAVLWRYTDPTPEPGSPVDKLIVGDALYMVVDLLERQYGLEQEWIPEGAPVDYNQMELSDRVDTPDPAKANTVEACRRCGWRLKDGNPQEWYRKPSVSVYKLQLVPDAIKNSSEVSEQDK